MVRKERCQLSLDAAALLRKKWPRLPKVAENNGNNQIIERSATTVVSAAASGGVDLKKTAFAEYAANSERELPSRKFGKDAAWKVTVE